MEGIERTWKGGERRSWGSNSTRGRVEREEEEEREEEGKHIEGWTRRSEEGLRMCFRIGSQLI